MKKRVLIALVVALALLATASLVWANGDGLISYWPFDEGSGTTANDAVNGNHGTIYGATYTTDKAPVIGNAYALAFDGNDYVQVADSETLESSEVTVAAWVKSSSPGTYGYILAKGASGCSAASYALYSRGTNGLYFYISPNGSSYVLSPNGGASVWDGDWHHVAGTYDGSAVRLYVDGAEIGSGSATSIAIGYDLPTTDDFFVGAYRGSCSLHFNGLIDEVRVWNRVLSADEVAALLSPVVEVAIDIKPGSDPNCFNSDGHGVIPVAILGSTDFDVSQIDPGTVTLEDLAIRAVGKSNKLLAHIEDVNDDGFDDLVVQVEDGDGAFQPGEGSATVTGELFDGTPIEGSDSICIVP